MSSKAQTQSAFTARGPFRASAPDPALFVQRSLTKTDWKVLGAIMAVAVVVRIWGLDWPASVVFDEVHFGGFAKKYIIGRFFFDVHPPLAKMLFAVFAFLGGFDPDTDFEFTPIGRDYIRDHIPYITMRMLPALCGLGTIALCYATLRASGCRTSAAAVAALVLTFENTFVTESRYILLDAPLVFFIAVSVYAFKRFENAVPLRRQWFRYLFLTGLGLGATVSSKWVGLFTIGWVGTLTLYQLWIEWGDLNVGVPRFVKQFAYRAVFLIAVPLTVYVGMFVLHFYCVDNYGDGAELLPRWFQASLKHNTLPTNVPGPVAFGSVVTLRHADTQGGWLHSHMHTYPAGSEQQQVTLYSHADENNLWRFDYADRSMDNQTDTEIHYLKDGDIVRLWHLQTQRRLHSHDHRAPVTPHDYVFEVSAYGFPEFEGDLNDNWRIIIVGQRSIGDGKDGVKALRTYFQLQHVNLGCLLYSKNVRLPEWGFEQQEVSCIRGGKTHNTVWVVESNVNPLLPGDVELVNYEKPGFWKKFLALNAAMWRVNKDLTEPHMWESRPMSWIQLKRGINMWGESNRQVYLVGNLPVYWLVALSVAVLVVVKVLRLLAWQHVPGFQFAFGPNSALALFDAQFGRYALGWWFHLFPSFLMVRQLFLHHYLGSLYFGVLMIGQIIELLLSVRQKPRVARIAIGVFAASVFLWFYLYAPLAYGSPWTRDKCLSRKFFDMDFECNLFFEDGNAYKSQALELKESKYSAFYNLSAPPTSTPVQDEEEEHKSTVFVQQPAHESQEQQEQAQPSFVEPEGALQPEEIVRQAEEAARAQQQQAEEQVEPQQEQQYFEHENIIYRHVQQPEQVEHEVEEQIIEREVFEEPSDEQAEAVAEEAAHVVEEPETLEAAAEPEPAPEVETPEAAPVEEHVEEPAEAEPVVFSEETEVAKAEPKLVEKLVVRENPDTHEKEVVDRFYEEA